MAEELTPEQQKALEDVLNNRKNIPYVEVKGNLLDIFRDKNFKKKNLNEEKLKEFWKIFGWIPNFVIGDIIGNTIKNVSGVATTSYSEEDLPTRKEDIGMSYAQYTNMISYSLGREWDNLEPEVQEGFNYIYEITPPEDLRKIAVAAGDHHDLLIEAVLQGKNPADIRVSFEDANIEVLNTYSEESDLARKAYYEKQAREDAYKESAFMLYDKDNAESLLLELESGKIDKTEYLKRLDIMLEKNNIDPADFLQNLKGQEVGSVTGPVAIEDTYLSSVAMGLTGGEYYGIAGEVIPEVYGEGEEPLYEYGLGRQLFANASPEEIMEVQLLLVESGFLQPFSFVYGVLDNNDGGTVQAIESAMSRFNLNGETISQEDLYSILLTPGATAQNLTVFIKEFYKDTLEDYGYGKDKFAASEGAGVNYQSLFKYINPSPYSVKATIGSAIEEGLGRPASDYELSAYADYISKLSYDIQKENFKTNESNIQAQIAAERQRAQAAQSGMPYENDLELQGTVSQEQMGAVIGQEFDEFVKDKYGDMLQGQRDTALYNNTFVNLLTNIGNIGRYVRGK